MSAVVVVESSFGNSRQVAEAIAAGLGPAEVVEVDAAPTTFGPEVDLVVIGGPTHAFGMSRSSTRSDAAKQGGSAAARGIREWLDELQPSPRLAVATFDTRVTKARRLPGSAARGVARAARKRGLRLVTEPVSFYVRDVAGPLEDGELDRARTWGERLGRGLALL